MRPTALEQSSTLIHALQVPSLYDHPVQSFQVIETHISWVLLTGRFAYKIKKPVNLGFVDFSTLDRRKFFCEEELRLNRRLAPDLYLGMIAITGSHRRPALNGRGCAIEYAVKMVQFPQENLLPHVLARGELQPLHLDELAKVIADFHGRISVADETAEFGTPEILNKPVLENFQHLPELAFRLLSPQRIETLRNWTENEFSRHRHDFQKRKHDGFVRECHGDLHLGNMALVRDRLVIFDCIEFNDALRWIDVMSELAFVVMDLIDRQCPDFAARLLNAYLEHTGDYQGLTVFRYYQTYRAMVRAKVAGIRLDQAQAGHPDHLHMQDELRSYLELAERLSRRTRPALWIMHGLSGSGKTTIAQLLVDRTGAIRIRSDIERKRLFGLSPNARTGSEQRPTLYSREATHVTYDHLAKLAEQILTAGFTVIVDATFLKKTQRQTFQRLAQHKHVPFRIVDVRASESQLQERVAAREATGTDASEATVAVLEQQFQHHEPLSPDERAFVVTLRTDEPLNPDILIQALVEP